MFAEWSVVAAEREQMLVYQWICYCKFDLIAIGGKCITAIPFCARHGMLYGNEYMHIAHHPSQ